jgi:choline dehydrogenase-like flavoprotein
MASAGTRTGHPVAAPDTYDYVIVGAGTAGCVLAARLSEDPSVRVCVIEAGPRDSHPFIHVPALVGAAIGTPRINWRFLTQPQPQLNNRQIPVPRGRVLGGTGSINGMAYFRGQPRDFDDWAAAGNAGWSWREVLPYFIRSEHNEDYAGSPYHGLGGPICVTHIRRPNPLNRCFLDAFGSLGGYSPCADFTGPNPEGYGMRQGTIRHGRRDSTANAYLKPALGRPNLTVLTDALVTNVALEQHRAIGVDALIRNEPRRIAARRETLLCAGAIQSPQLLMLSGIGDGDALAAVGIPVRHHLPGVGAHYQDHLAVSVLLESTDTRSYGISLRTLPRAVLNLLQYAANRSGPLGSNLFESTAFIRSSPQAERPDLQIAFQPARRNRGSFPLPLGHGFALSCVNLYPRSTGRVSLLSANPRSPPALDPNLLGDATDIQPLLQGLRLARRLIAAPAFASLRAVEVAPGPDLNSDSALIDYIRHASSTVHHPTSTCRMGGDSEAVVDASLRVHGIEHLRVADASVFPSIVGGNTNAAVVMVAEKAADLLRGRPAPPPFQA